MTYIICGTTVKTTGRRFTILRGVILQLVGPVGRSRYRHYRRPEESILPLQTSGSALLLEMGSIRASLPHHLSENHTLSTKIISGW